jgi:hypothetical protein
VNHFTPIIAEQLRCYVYRLIDPRNGMTFYVGRGRGNRVFAHAADEIRSDNEDVEDLKLRTIRAIKASGLEVEHLIHRHGLDETTAKEIEAALIDAYPGLTNIQPGEGTNRGVMHVREIEQLYAADEAAFDSENIMLVNVGTTAEEKPLIDAARFAWKADKSKAEKADYVLAERKGMIIGVFVAKQWLDATPENFPGFPVTEGKRIGFLGHEAPIDVQNRFLRKRAPARKRGEANPVRYRYGGI